MSRRGREWQLADRDATPEGLLLDRRRFVETVALGSLFVASAPVRHAIAITTGAPAAADRAVRPTGFGLDRALTEECAAAACSPYLEFTPNRDAQRFADTCAISPCRIEIHGLVEKPRVIDLDDLRRLAPLEERLYRHRCVEGWAAAVPWLGIPLAALVRAARPLRAARFVRFESLPPPHAPDTDAAPAHVHLPWPYTEGLTLAEATNELAFLATGIYGHDLPLHHGAPVRLVLPWKYAFKSIKAVARIAFTATAPATFWNTLAPHEYPFHGNVDPDTPHPRWSQRTEKMLGSGEARATLAFNGYAEWVAHLYA